MAWMNQHETNCEVAREGQSKFVQPVVNLQSAY